MDCVLCKGEILLGVVGLVLPLLLPGESSERRELLVKKSARISPLGVNVPLIMPATRLRIDAAISCRKKGTKVVVHIAPEYLRHERCQKLERIQLNKSGNKKNKCKMSKCINVTERKQWLKSVRVSDVDHDAQCIRGIVRLQFRHSCAPAPVLDQ